MRWKEEVLKKIKPNREEEKDFYQAIKDFLKKIDLKPAKAVLGGSAAKGTWLKGKKEADIFAVYKEREKSCILADMLGKRLKGYERLHGSRDYFQVKEKRFLFEIIPVLEAKKAKDSLNITDMSPLHSKWVNKNSDEKVRDEIRIAKAFCQAQRCYGAESYIRGFSGYVLEILIIHYGSFEKLLKAAVKWKEKEVVDTKKFYKNKEEVFLNLNTSKLVSPIIVIDPVDKCRNAAAALSKETFELFRKKAAEFLKKPSADYFIADKVSFEKLKKSKKNLIWMEVEANEGKGDKIGAQLMLAYEFLKKMLGKFGIIKSGWEWKQEGIFWFVLKKKELSKTEVREGPPVSLEEHVTRFKKEHKKTFVKNGKVFAEVPVENYKIEDVVKELVAKEYFKGKVKKVKKIKIS